MKNCDLGVKNDQKRMLEMNKMAAGRHLEFDTLVPRARLCPPGSQLRTPWTTSVPNFSFEQRKKTNFHFWSRFATWLGD